MARQNNGIIKKVKDNFTRIDPAEEEAKRRAAAQAAQQPSPTTQNGSVSKGAYDAARGGFVATDGKFYPTKNPDFVPGKTDSSVKFNPDGTVALAGADGKSQTLTAQEYQTYLGKAGQQTNAVQAAQAQPNLQQEAQNQAIANIGNIGELTPATEAGTNFLQAATAGIAGVIPGAAAGAAAGALALGVPTAGAAAIPGAIGGAVVGGIGTFIGTALGNIKRQQKDEIGVATNELNAAKTQMRQLAMMASRDPANADYYISLYNKQLTRVAQARRQVKAETSGNLNSWISDGRTELAEFDAFLRPGGLAELYGQKLQVSLQSGVPLSITGDELFVDENL